MWDKGCSFLNLNLDWNVCLFVFQNELNFHTIGEDPIRKQSEFLDVMAVRTNIHHMPQLQIGQAKFHFPHNMTFIKNLGVTDLLNSTLEQERHGEKSQGISLGETGRGHRLSQCLHLHMTNYKHSPFASSKVQCYFRKRMTQLKNVLLLYLVFNFSLWAYQCD